MNTKNNSIGSQRKTARIAGLLYLALAITGSFGIIYIPNKSIAGDDSLTIANNIMDNEMLFRTGLVNNLISLTIFIFLVLTLNRLLKKVDPNQAQLMIVLVVVSVSVGCLNLLNLIAPLVLLGDVDFLTEFEPDQLNVLVMFFLKLYKHGIYIQELFWGLWLLPLGLLIFRSGFIPKIFGILLIIACIGWMIASMASLLIPDERLGVFFIATGLSAIGELSIILWLLIIGIKEKQRFDQLV